MAYNGYAIASPADADWRNSESDVRYVSFTEHLGCTDTHVDYYRIRAGESITLSSRREALCVPLDAAGELTVAETRSVSPCNIARIPAGTDCTVGSDAGTTWLIVSASVEPSPQTSAVVVDTDKLEYTVSTASDILTARLTARLGCQGMKTNIRLLQPGDVVPYHTEGSQEELFVPLDGPGRIRVAGTTHSLRAGDVVRVAPELSRGAINEADQECQWLMIGAPPTGDVDGWDPGAEVVEWPHDE